MQAMTKEVPDELRTEDRHVADGKAIVDMGYCIEFEADETTEWVTITPGETRAQNLVSEFVCRTMENLGFRTVELVAGKAVFSRVKL